MADEENFANHPLSIAEIKSSRSGDGSDWTPRDALIAALRDVDSGEQAPTCCVICFGTVSPEGITKTYMYQSTANRFELMGLIESVQADRWKADLRE